MKGLHHLKHASGLLLLAALLAFCVLQTWHTDRCARQMEAHFIAVDAETATPRFFLNPDSYAWLSHARDWLNESGFRKRWTNMDNVPVGREFHWSQSLIWGIAGLAKGFQMAGIADNQPHAIELAGIWIMPLCQLLCFGLLALWMGRRIGWWAATLFCLLGVTAYPLRHLFHPLEPDHHGIQIMAMLGCLAGLTFGRFGWCKPQNDEYPQAKRDFILSGMAGSIACWIGGTVFLWELAVIGAVALFALPFMQGSGGGGRKMIPHLWRVWGLSGAIGCLFFWGLEYAPNHMAMRLEVNHPLYALTFLGLGETFRFLAMWSSDWSTQGIAWRDRVAGSGGIILAGILPLCILFGPDAWFWPRTAALETLHKYFILEFRSPLEKPFPAMLASLWEQFGLFFLIPAWLLIRYAFEKQEPQRTLWATLLIALLMAGGMTLWLWRWSYLLAALFIWSAAMLATQLRHTSGWRKWGGICVLGTCLLGALWDGYARIQEERASATATAPDEWWGEAAAFKRLAVLWTQALGPAEVRWAGWFPNTPTIYYFTGQSSLASYYWENKPGIEAECRLFADSIYASAAKAIIQERGLTHFAWHPTTTTPLIFDTCKHGDINLRRTRQTLGARLNPQLPAALNWLAYQPAISQETIGFSIQKPDKTFQSFPLGWQLYAIQSGVLQ